MGHPDSGLLQALVDGELGQEELDGLRSHAEACPKCRSELEALEGASAATGAALEILDVEPDLAATRLRVLDRRGRRSSRRPLFGSWTLPRAASIALLLTGATVSALPGSPVRRWIVQGWQAITQPSDTGLSVSTPETVPDDPTTLSPGQDAAQSGAGIALSDEGVEIWIHGLSSQADLRVQWTDGEEAWVYAGEGTRFTSTDGRLEAFDPPGLVRVEIPLRASRVVLGLDGSVLLRKSGGELEILGPVRERTPSEIRFRPPEAPNGGVPPGVQPS